MLRTVTSFLIVDVMEATSFPVNATEYARREDAERAFERLRDCYPDARIREHQALYELSDPHELERYERHMRRLNA